MVDMTQWRHKDEWKREGKHFCVTVSRHRVPWKVDVSEGENRWCVYVYIYPTHPSFAAFSTDVADVRSYWDQPTLPMHGGCTFFKVHRDDEGGVRSIQYGCDYSHYQDDHYHYMATPNDAWSVFADADELFSIMAEREQTP